MKIHGINDASKNSSNCSNQATLFHWQARPDVAKNRLDFNRIADEMISYLFFWLSETDKVHFI